MFNVLMDTLGHEKKWRVRLKGHEDLEMDISSYYSFICDFCLEGRIDDAEELFKSMTSRGCEPDDVLTYNELISGYYKSGRLEEAMSLYGRMVHENHGQFGSNHALFFHFNHVLAGLYREGKVEDAPRKLFNEMLARGGRPEDATYIILLDGLCKNQLLSEAMELLQALEDDKFEELSTEIFNILIQGMCNAGKLDIAMELCYKLTQNGLKPDVVTYTILINACLCKDGELLEKTNELFVQMEEKGCAPDTTIFNALMHGFSKIKEEVAKSDSQLP